jgi:hypothetical protein
MHELALFLQQQPDVQQIQRLMLTIVPLILVFILIGIVILIVPFWFICKKAGFSPWLSLLCLVPSVGMLILLYVLAFADWKVVPAAPTAWGPPPQPYPPQPPYPRQPPYPPQG